MSRILIGIDSEEFELLNTAIDYFVHEKEQYRICEKFKGLKNKLHICEQSTSLQKVCELLDRINASNLSEIELFVEFLNYKRKKG